MHHFNSLKAIISSKEYVGEYFTASEFMLFSVRIFTILLLNTIYTILNLYFENFDIILYNGILLGSAKSFIFLYYCIFNVFL